MLNRLLPTFLSMVVGIVMGATLWMSELPILSALSVGFFFVAAVFCLLETQENWDKWFGWLTW